MNAKNDFSFLLVHVWGASQRGGGADLSAAGGQEDMEEKWKRRKPAYWLWGVEGEPGHWATSRFLSHKKNISLLPHHLQVEVNRCSRVQCVAEQAASSIYMDSRSVTVRWTLTLGRYVVLPTTFLLRLFSHSVSDSGEMLVRKEGLEIALNVLIFVDAEKVRRTKAAQRFQNQNIFLQFYFYIFHNLCFQCSEFCV